MYIYTFMYIKTRIIFISDSQPKPTFFCRTLIKNVLHRLPKETWRKYRVILFKRRVSVTKHNL